MDTTDIINLIKTTHSNLLRRHGIMTQITRKVTTNDLFNPWQMMIDLNAGLELVMDLGTSERLMQYFKIHGKTLEDFVIEFSGNGEYILLTKKAG